MNYKAAVTYEIEAALDEIKDSLGEEAAIAFVKEAAASHAEGRSEDNLWYWSDSEYWRHYMPISEICYGPYHFEVRGVTWQLN